jgi:hypothetical protein
VKSALFVLLLSPLLFAANQPKFGWKPAGSETFALNATENKSFPIPQQGKWRFQLKADTAVYVGMASAEQNRAHSVSHTCRLQRIFLR